MRKTKRDKDTKRIAIADTAGPPLAMHTDSATNGSKPASGASASYSAQQAVR